MNGWTYRDGFNDGKNAARVAIQSRLAALERENAELLSDVDALSKHVDCRSEPGKTTPCGKCLVCLEEQVRKLTKEREELNEALKISYTDSEKELGRMVLRLREQVRVLREACLSIDTKTHLHLTFGCANGGEFNPECARCVVHKALAATEPGKKS